MHTVLMGSVLRLVALVLATSSISGCFHSMDMVRERHRPGRTLESSDTTESLIEKTRSVTLSYQLVEGELRVDAQETHRCSRERLDTYSNVEIVTQHLPSSHWWTFGSGLLLSGVGAAGILMGADLNPEGADGSIMEPGEAEDRDMGRIMVPVGTAIAAVGFFLLLGGISSQSLVQNVVVPEFRARVLSLYLVASFGLPSVGALAMGMIASVYGLQETIGAGAVLAVLIWNWARPIAGRAAPQRHCAQPARRDRRPARPRAPRR